MLKEACESWLPRANERDCEAKTQVTSRLRCAALPTDSARRPKRRFRIDLERQYEQQATEKDLMLDYPF